MKKRILSVFICLCMVLTMIPMTSVAAETDTTVDVMDAPYNAKGDGATNDRAAIQAAIDAVYAAGGGTVVLTAGKTFWSGNIILKSNVTLEFGEGAILKQSSNPADFVKPSGDGYVAYQPEYGHNTIEGVRWGHSWYENYPLVYAGEGSENVKITGNGTIEMTPGAICDTTLHMCPVGFYRVNNFEISDITITKCSNYGMMPYHCNNGLIKNIKMNDFVDANGDGISLQNCQNIRITGCNLTTTDDTIYIFTSYQDPRGGTWWNSDNPQPSKNIEIDNNVCDTPCKAFGFILWGEACPNQSLVEASNVYVHDNTFSSMGIWYNDPFVNGTDTSTPANTPIKNIRFENNNIKKIQSNFYETEISDMNLYQSMTRIKNGDFEDRESYWVLKENEKSGSAGISKYSAGQQGTYMGYIQNLDQGDAKIYQGLFFQKDITYTFTANVQTSGAPVRLFVRNLDTQELVASKEISNTEWVEETLTFKVPEKGNYHIGLERGDATSGWARIDVASVEGEAANSQTILTSQTPTEFKADTTYELGTRFKSSRAGKITKVRIYTYEQESGIHTVRLWDQAAKTMIAGPFEWYVPYGTTGWQEFKLPTPVGIEANKDYVVAVSNNGTTKYYPIGSGDDNSFKTAISNGYLTTYASSGLWSRKAEDMPYNKVTSNYFRDVVFVPEENSILTTQVPDSYGNDNIYELGTLFQTKVAGKITKVRLYTKNTEAGVHTVRIWDQATKTVLAGPYEWDITAGKEGWKEYELPTPLSISANTSYVVSVSTSTDKIYAKGSISENSYAAPILNGDLVTYASSGLWFRGTGTMPYNRGATNYFRDIVFVADQEADSTDIDKTVLEKKILASNSKTQGNATNSSWSAFQTALTNAQTVYANESATQNDVDVATASLQAAIDGMTYQQVLNAPTVSLTGDGSVALTNASGEALGTTVLSGDKINVNVTVPEGGELLSLKVCKSDDLETVVQEFDVTTDSAYFLMPTYEVSVIAEFSELPAELKLTGATLQLENDITVIFESKVENYAGVYSNPYINVVHELENGEIKTTKVDGVLNEAGTEYNFFYEGVEAKQVGDSLVATIYAYDADGNLVQGDQAAPYSAKAYCTSMFNKTEEQLGVSADKYTKLRTLLVDLLNYSSAAQIYFCYKEDVLVNADLSTELQALASSDDALETVEDLTATAYEKNENSTVIWKGATLALLNKVYVRVKIQYAGDVNNIKAIFELEGGETYKVTEFVEYGDGLYYADLDKVTAFQMETPIYAKIMEGDTVISDTVRYSISSYAYRYQNDEKVGEVVREMMKYGKAADAYKYAQ